jgi:hypothetical protein
VAVCNGERTESYHSGARPGGEGTYRDGVSNRLRNNGREGQICCRRCPDHCRLLSRRQVLTLLSYAGSDQTEEPFS